MRGKHPCNPRHRRLNRRRGSTAASNHAPTIEPLEQRLQMDGGSAPIISGVEPIDTQNSKVTYQLSKDEFKQYPTLVAHSAQMTYYGPDVTVSGGEFDSDTGRGWGIIPTYWGTSYQIRFWSVYFSGESDGEAAGHSVTPPAPAAPSDFSNEAVYDGHPALLGHWQRNGTDFMERQWYYGDKPGDQPTLINDYPGGPVGPQGRQVDVQFPGEHRIGVQNFIVDPDNNNEATTSQIYSGGGSALIKPPPPSAPGGVQVMHDTTPDDVRVTVMEDNRVFAKTGYELQREDVAKHDWKTIWFGFPRSDDEQSQDVIDAAVPIGPTYRYRVRAVAPDVNGNLIDGDWVEGGDVETTHHYFVAWIGSGSQTTTFALHYGVGEQPAVFKDGRAYRGSGLSVVFTLPAGMHWMTGSGGDAQRWTWTTPGSYNVLFGDALASGTYGVTYTVLDGGASVASGTLYLRVT